MGISPPRRTELGKCDSFGGFEGSTPRTGIYLIQDNLSTHATPAAVSEARKLRITLVPTPTNASHPNPIETHFRTSRRWAFTGSNYTDWEGAKEALPLTMRRLNRIHCVTNSHPAHRWWTRH
jgi:hypothetical protein